VSRKGAGNKVSLKVDGKAIDGTVVPPAKDGKKEVKVEAILG
jgi:cellobiose phosphorylase